MHPSPHGRMQKLFWLVITIVVLPTAAVVIQHYFLPHDLGERLPSDVGRLVDPSPATRQLAVDEIGKIARASRNHDEEICNALAAFVRSPAKGEPNNSMASEKSDVSTSIQILSYLSSRNRCQRLNLRYADLQGLELRGGTLANVDFTGAHLEDSIFVGSNLSGANFTAAHLARIDLCKARATNANWSESDIHQAVFRHADLDRSTGFLTAGNIGSAMFEGASLNGVNLGRYRYLADRLTNDTCD